MPFHWMLRAVHWLRNPPSKRMVWMILGIAAFGIALATFEWMFGWPEALTVNPMHRGIGDL